MMVLMPLGLANAVKQSMANHRKHRGYRTQKVIAEYLNNGGLMPIPPVLVVRVRTFSTSRRLASR
jgi:hypothetical protein